jgi:hypothetical protein
LQELQNGSYSKYFCTHNCRSSLKERRKKEERKTRSKDEKKNRREEKRSAVGPDGAGPKKYIWPISVD